MVRNELIEGSRMQNGQLVRPTAEALEERVFGMVFRNLTFNPGQGTVLSTSAPMPGCLIVRFRSGERMVHAEWLEPAVQ